MSNSLKVGLVCFTLFFGQMSIATAATFETMFFNSFEEDELRIIHGGKWSSARTQNPCFLEDCLPDKRPSVVKTVSETKVSGQKSLSCFADGGDSHYVSKADVYKTDVRLDLGETYRVSAWYKVLANTFVKTVTIMDLECHTCSKTAGPRLWIDGRYKSGVPTITFGRGKLSEQNIKTSFPVPLGRWFKLTVELTFGSGGNGRTQVLIDDQKAIDFVGTNAKPNSIPDLDHYDFLQFGITANATGTEPNGQYSAFTLYIDDVKIEHQIDDTLPEIDDAHIEPCSTASYNLFGVDPQFVNPAKHDFEANRRRQGKTADIGAYEFYAR